MKTKRTIVIIAVSVVSLGSAYLVWAEQSGGSPDSTADSRVKATYDSVAALGYGSESAGEWGNWGTWWNRLRSAAEWTPSGSATAAQTAKDLTLYAGSRSQIVGTATNLINYSAQSLQSKDDNAGVTHGEQSTWTNTSTNVWKDERTGLYWSNSQGNQTNDFTIASCDFYTTTPRGDYTGADADCGNAINTCATLELDADGDASAEDDWYLPSQGELQQAYLNNMYNQAGSGFTTTSRFWSSSERSDDSTNAWGVGLHSGRTDYNTKTDSYAVRCARRD